jgi:diaminopimelate epimerase
MGRRLGRDQFVRSDGLGNDYLVVDPRRLSFKLTRSGILRICDRHRGVGSDGILSLEKPSSRSAAARLRIFNPDGSEAEKSGNGLRIFCKFLFEHGYTRRRVFDIETAGGRVTATLHVKGRRVPEVTVDMGRASFDAATIPVKGFTGEVVEKPLEVEGLSRPLVVTCVTVGNPHCVVFTDALNEQETCRLGARLENHPRFPNRSNVQFARVKDRREVAIQIWERGAGWTLASGSSSCAVAAASVRTGRTDRELTVAMPGGRLGIVVGKDWALRMRGPVSESCVGTFSGDLLDDLRKG